MIKRDVHIALEGGFNQLARCRHGLMLFNRYDHYIGASLRKYGEWSENELTLFQQLVPSGSVVVEGGANVGAHTVALSKLVGISGAVHAFEPQRLVFQTLCANLALNGCANVYAYHAALGARTGEVLVPALPPDRPANFGGVGLQNVSSGERTPLRMIDELDLHVCRLIKLDVEGMEAEALQGAAQTVRRLRPLLYVENDRRHLHEVLIRLLHSWSYDAYWHVPPYFSKDNFAGDQENIFGQLASVNVACFPAELHVSVPGAKKIEICGAGDVPALQQP
jgi:FkbM family methyltransferase